MGSERAPEAAGAPIELRAVAEGDVEVFFHDQLDPEASEMAVFAARSRDEHFAHWGKILADDTAILRTIESDGAVAGNVVSWLDGDKRLVGYWVGKSFWGRGIATNALRAFLTEIDERPLHAYVAVHNLGSIRVLEKCGFVATGPPRPAPDAPPGVAELLMELRASG